MGYEELFEPLTFITNRLYLGSMLDAKNRDLLLRHNITHVLIVAANLTQHFPQDFSYKQISVVDDESFDLLSHIPSCIDFITSALSAGGSVLVHCAAGVSRSATVVISHLMATQRLSVARAHQAVKQRRPAVCPNSGFMKQLQLFEEMSWRVDPSHPAYIDYRETMLSGEA